MKRFSWFLFGGAFGALLGLLVAPRSGEETRALIADKADEYWGKSQEIYNQGVNRIQESAAKVPENLTKKSDELKEKIDTARNLIADQVARNAVAARDALADKIPVAAERINAVVDAAHNQFENAANALKGKADQPQEETAGDSQSEDQVPGQTVYPIAVKVPPVVSDTSSTAGSHAIPGVLNIPNNPPAAGDSSEN